MKTFEKNLAKMHERNAIDLKHLKNQPFSCETDAIRAAERFLKKLRYQTLSYRIVRKDVYKQKGRPSKNQAPQEQEWLVGEFHSDDEAVTRAKQGKGMFVVATSELDQEILSDEQVISVYKDQGVSVERGFRFLKDPYFYAGSLYLKKPQRIMALIMVNRC